MLILHDANSSWTLCKLLRPPLHRETLVQWQKHVRRRRHEADSRDEPSNQSIDALAAAGWVPTAVFEQMQSDEGEVSIFDVPPPSECKDGEFRADGYVFVPYQYSYDDAMLHSEAAFRALSWGMPAPAADEEHVAPAAPAAAEDHAARPAPRDSELAQGAVGDMAQRSPVFAAVATPPFTLPAGCVVINTFVHHAERIPARETRSRSA